MFRYFHDPHNFSTYTLEPQQCEICGEHRPGYGGSFYGPEDLDFVCEDCLANGKLAERNFTTNHRLIYLFERAIGKAAPRFVFARN